MYEIRANQLRYVLEHKFSLCNNNYIESTKEFTISDQINKLTDLNKEFKSIL
jgi:hypothetical protein